MDEVKFAQEIKRMVDTMNRPAYSELMAISAKDAFMKYQSFMRAGFDAKQALELVIRGVAK